MCSLSFVVDNLHMHSPEELVNNWKKKVCPSSGTTCQRFSFSLWNRSHQQLLSIWFSLRLSFTLSSLPHYYSLSHFLSLLLSFCPSTIPKWAFVVIPPISEGFSTWQHGRLLSPEAGGASGAGGETHVLSRGVKWLMGKDVKWPQWHSQPSTCVTCTHVRQRRCWHTGQVVTSSWAWAKRRAARSRRTAPLASRRAVTWMVNQT